MSQERRPNRGVLVALEGIDGSGKTTVATAVRNLLIQEGFPVLLTHEPTEFMTGQVLRQRLSEGHSGTIVDAEIDTDYFFADRVYHNQTVVKPQLESGVNVVSDRYDLGTLAYQSTQGLPLEYLLERRRWLLSLALVERPVLNIVFDVSPATAVSRLAKAGKRREKFENEEFLAKLRETYQRLLSVVDDPIAVVDAERDVSEVVKDVYKKIRSLL